jgi:hypothetical protein
MPDALFALGPMYWARYAFRGLMWLGWYALYNWSTLFMFSVSGVWRRKANTHEASRTVEKPTFCWTMKLPL